MERATTALYLDYDQRRKQDEARQADAQDDAELKALKNSQEALKNMTADDQSNSAKRSGI